MVTLFSKKRFEHNFLFRQNKIYKVKLKVPPNKKRKKLHAWVSFIYKYGKFWSLSPEQKVEVKPLFSEEWLGILYTKLLYLNLIGNALQCHQCDSSKDVKCILSFHSNSNDNMDFLKDCPDDGKNYTNCRIIYPSYNQYHIDIDTRIIRECGYKGDGWSKTYNEVFTANIKFFIYNCVEDGCNTGNEKWWLNNSNINQSSILCIISILMVLLLNILIG